MKNEDKLTKWLFESGAFKVSPAERPFWYTSGTIGPYYINTHFLYGGEADAEEMLRYIDEVKEDPLTCRQNILQRELNKYENNPIYRGVIDKLVSVIKEKPSMSRIGFISGGERRDWYFSVLPAHILQLPHIMLFKNGRAVLSINDRTEYPGNLNGAEILHIADLVTEASSYIRDWIPALKSIGGRLTASLAVIDRKQGGTEILNNAGVEAHSLIGVNESLFRTAMDEGLINEKQYKMLVEYARDPRGSMSRFLAENPEFLEASLKADERTASRARLCVEKKIYTVV